MGVPEREEREKYRELFEEIMSENFPILRKEPDIQIPEEKSLN